MSSGGGGGGSAQTVAPAAPSEPTWQGPAQQTYSPILDPAVMQQLVGALPQSWLDSLAQSITYTPHGVLPPINPTNTDVWTGKKT